MAYKKMRKNAICPECGETVASRGLHGHLRFKHDMTADEARAASVGVEPFEVKPEPELEEGQPDARVVALLEGIVEQLNGEVPDDDDDQDDEARPLSLSYVVIESVRRLHSIDADRQLIAWARPTVGDDADAEEDLFADAPEEVEPDGTDGAGVLTDDLADRLDAELLGQFDALRLKLADLVEAHDADLQDAEPSDVVVQPVRSFSDWFDDIEAAA